MQQQPILATSNEKQIKKFWEQNFPRKKELKDLTVCDIYGHFAEEAVHELKVFIAREHDPDKKQQLMAQLDRAKSALQELVNKNCGPTPQTANWRDRLLQSNCQRIVQRAKGNNEAYAAMNTGHAQTILTPFFNNNLRFFSDLTLSGLPVTCKRGSTFVSNCPGILHEKNKVLDHACGVYTYTAGKISGFSLALGDGSGGHFGDETQDIYIARAAWFASKHATRLLASFPAPEAIFPKLNFILLSLSQELHSKAGMEGTTLVAARAFFLNSQLRVVGFNIGDSTLIGWDPVSQKAFNVAPAHVSDAGTAIFPIAYRPFEVYPIDIILPPSTILLVLSDGVTDNFPAQKSKEGQYPNKLAYREKIIDENFLATLLTGANTTDDIAQRLLQRAIADVEEKRVAERSSNSGGIFQIGDDVCVLAMQMPQMAITTTNVLPVMRQL